jgi:hypothetical protein
MDSRGCFTTTVWRSLLTGAQWGQRSSVYLMGTDQPRCRSPEEKATVLSFLIWLSGALRYFSL